MRKPKGKLVALLAGAVVVVLLAVTAMYWKDIYCHLFLDPRLVGRWESDGGDSKPMMIQFDRIGNVRAVEGELHTGTGTYHIDGTTLILAWPEEENPNEMAYEVGDTLSLERDGEDGDRIILRRVPDDS